ncbi:terpenoid synthase [Aspergillus steynii IBT 23096]|uniref:Terpenoid synthase n=1 Tax=Aspergillus steynii IBT 23096 TaxID=1392250 RepID=A0A2I2G772_9EURO|nr:terpenoid synthase [Aspergillus steynii IBT 23096]PLB48720.1 terpenoid synthase [Aspergillus steynii IBT 23096]
MDFTTNRAEFDAVLQYLIDEMTGYFKQIGLPSDAIKHVQESFDTNVRNGKLFRGLSVPETGYILLERPLSVDEFHDLSILGWLVEMLQAYLLVLDDIIDGSITRRNQICWYRRPEVGLTAINDACLIKSAVFFLLKNHFRTHPSYLQMLESFNEITILTESGQEADAIASREKCPGNWTLDQYRHITLLKGGYYCFYLSVLLGLQYLNLATPLNMREAEAILIPLGQFYQFQNDFLDIFGHTSRTGKVGTDIQANKCSWVVIQALRICQDDRHDTMLEKYGRPEHKAAAEVDEIFQSLPLARLYEREAEEVLGGLRKKITNVNESEGLRKGIFELLTSMVHRLPN